MPPPPSTPLSEICRKRAHSSHYSTGLEETLGGLAIGMLLLFLSFFWGGELSKRLVFFMFARAL